MASAKRRLRGRDDGTRPDRGGDRRGVRDRQVKKKRESNVLNSRVKSARRTMDVVKTYQLRPRRRSEIRPDDRGSEDVGRCENVYEAFASCDRCKFPPARGIDGDNSTTIANRKPPPSENAASSCRECHPENFPDLDFHHSFGSFLTRKNPVSDSTVDPDIGRLWHLLNRSPSRLQMHIHEIGDAYRRAFRGFFTAEPISLHGHVSDASSPALLTSLIGHLGASASASASAFTSGVGFLKEKDRVNPRVAILEGSYGAGFGPLAYNSVLDFVRPLANGKCPIVVRINDPKMIEEQVKTAKESGCVALIAEIVRARDGVVITSTAWKHLLLACRKYSLVLVVDEALTAIRCGAPFAYQLPQYRRHGFPDLVLFGKAVKTNGVAVDWRGVNVSKLGIRDPEEREFVIREWQERLTEMAPAASLLASWGTLVLAQREQWPRRARVIGSVLRGIIEKDDIDSDSIGGLHSLIYLHVRDQARIKSSVMGANAGQYVRWFPMMDEVMMDEIQLRTKVFGSGSVGHRRHVAAWLRSQGLRLGFCARCAQAVEEGLKPQCELCVVETCEDCEPEGHTCPMLGLSG